MSTIKETHLKGTDYSYILGYEFVVFSNGVTMSIEEFKTFHNKGILVRKIMSLARVPKRLHDYRIALETGILTPIYMPIRATQLNPEKKKQKRNNREVIVVDYESVTEDVERREPVRRRRFIKPNKNQVIFYTMLFVAIGSACMSTYHVAAFLIYGGKPFIISALTAFMIVLFAATGFTAARYFSEQKGMAKIFSIPFILITSVLICYIAFSTTSVSYDQFRDEEAGSSAEVKKAIGSLELYAETQKNVAETERYLKSLERVDVNNITKYALARHQRMLSAEREKLQKLRDRAYELKERSGGGSIEQKQESIASVYDFLRELFGFNSRILRFIIYVIPAVFYDIVAPFGFTVVFFLVDNKPKEEQQDEA